MTQQALAGVRVLEIAQFSASARCPMVGWMMADPDAEVIKKGFRALE